MTRRAKNYLKGAGSILDIAPNTKYRDIIFRGNPAFRIERYWIRTGRHLRTSINRIADDQKKKEKKAA